MDVAREYDLEIIFYLYTMSNKVKQKSMLRLAIILFLCIATSHASDNASSQDIDIFKAYLKKLNSVAIDFTQTDSDDVEAEGKLLIVKPHKFLCNYYAPYPLLIVGNKSYVSVYDYDLEQLSRVPTDENMFNFLLTDKGEIEEHFHIEHILRNGNDFIVNLYHAESERRTIVTFDIINQRLKSIVTHEPDGMIITLAVTNIEQIKNAEPGLFILQDPEIYGAKKRLDKAALEKKYQIVRTRNG